MTLQFKKTMRLKPRTSGPERTEYIGGFKEEGYGYRVQDMSGEDLGYFGPDEYEEIIFEARITPSPRQSTTTHRSAATCLDAIV